MSPLFIIETTTPLLVQYKYFNLFLIWIHLFYKKVQGKTKCLDEEKFCFHKKMLICKVTSNSTAVTKMSQALPVTPECLMSREGLDQVWAELHLLVEELKHCSEAKLALVVPCCLCSGQLPISLGMAVMVGTAAENYAGLMLGGTAVGGSWCLRELSDQLLEQELAVMEATVVRHMHGHP